MGSIPPELPGGKGNRKTNWLAISLVGLFFLVMTPISGFIAYTALLWRLAQPW